MRFKSRQDILFQVILYGVCFILLYVLYQDLTINKIDGNSYIAGVVLISLIGLVLWILHGTYYVLNKEELIYKAAILRGKIPLDSIDELIVGKSMWSGVKPATARNGIIVIYDKTKRVYISPDSNETFVKKIKELNSGIKIVEKND
ncbi:MAG: PH domain-containing protein [Flavobacteriales bacterium]